MIDIHTHVLPGIDDGAESLATSQEMLRMAQGDGIAGIVATPHANHQYEFDFERCRELVEEIRRCCPDGPRLYPGCEVHLTPENVDRVMAHPRRYTLNGGDCLLLELPEEFRLQVIEPVLDALFGLGLRIIIAHPERNISIQHRRSIVDRLVERGCCMQITAQSINGGFGETAEAASGYMLTRRLAHFVASDAHGAVSRRPLLSAVFRKMRSRFGNAAANTLFVENPGAALSGAAIRQMPAPGNWFSSILSWRPNGSEQHAHQADLS